MVLLVGWDVWWRLGRGGILLEGLSVGFCEDAHCFFMLKIAGVQWDEDTRFPDPYIVLGDVLDGIFKSFRSDSRQLQKRGGSETSCLATLHRPLQRHVMFLAHLIRDLKALMLSWVRDERDPAVIASLSESAYGI